MGSQYDVALPLLSDQQLVFSHLLKSISYCKSMGSSAWSITQLRDGFRLNVGPVEAMTCRVMSWSAEDGSDHNTTDVTLRLLLAGADGPGSIALSHDSASIEEMSYRSVGAQHWCYEGTFQSGANGASHSSRSVVAEHLEKLRANHHEFLKLACHTPSGKLREKSNFAQHHSEALHAYAGSVGGGAHATEFKHDSDESRGIDMNPLVLTRLEKAAADCGFELAPDLRATELILRSAQFPESVAVQPLGNDGFILQASVRMLLPESENTTGRVRVQGWNALYEVLGKAAATARTLSIRVVQKFYQATTTMPKSTDAERWVVQRVGQNIFRKALLDYWQGRCCVTGLAVPELLRASHIQPWALCHTDEQRLDVFNGLLLSPNLDALFDGGWVTFMADGAMAIAASLSQTALELSGVGKDSRVQGLKPEHSLYMEFHRQRVFRGVGER